MREFWRYVESFPEFRAGWGDLLKHMTHQELATAHRAGLLVHRSGRINRVSCGIHGLISICQRWVRYDKGEPFGLCPYRLSSCGRALQPPDNDLRAWELDAEVCALTLQRLLRLQGLIDQQTWLGQPLWSLGHRDEARFFWLLQPHGEGFELLLSLLTNLQTDCWVLVPSWQRINPSLRQSFSVQAMVTLYALEDLVEQHEGEVILTTVPRKALQRPFSNQQRPPAPSPPPPPPLCMLYQRECAPTPLSAEAYEAFAASHEVFDLLIDLQQPKGARGHVVQVRRGQSVEEVVLTATEAYTLAFLMWKQAPLTLGEIAPLRNLSHPIKALERARRLVDEQLHRHAWRFFQTLPEMNGLPLRYHFQPPPGTRWGLVLPTGCFSDPIAEALQKATALHGGHPVNPWALRR